MIAIELFFDPATDRAVRGVWDDLERHGIGSLATSGHRRHHPHLTLAVIDAVTPTLVDRLAAELPALPAVHLDAAGCFPGHGGVVFLAIRATPELLEFHTRLHAILDRHDVGQIDQLRPGRLVPHCTVAKRLPDDRIGAAVALARTRLPISGTATSVNAVVVGRGEVSRLR